MEDDVAVHPAFYVYRWKRFRSNFTTLVFTTVTDVLMWTGVAENDYKKIIEPFDGSLAEELSAIRKKMERPRLEKEETEKMLDERDLVFDKHMEEMDKRWDTQRVFETEVDKLFRLNQLLRSSSLPIRSMREIQGGKKMKEAPLLMLEAKSEEEQK